ncbi:MAG: hypothetical protein RSF67_07280 [Clostridia bacterium]
MILPNKYISISESLIGLSACILEIISNKAYNVEYIWEKLNKDYIENNKIKYKPSYSKFILCITYMYLSKMINYKGDGVIFNENITT